MTAPTPPIPSFTDGTIVHQGSLNALSSNLTNLYNYTLGGFLNSPAFCITNQTIAQSIPNTTATPISFNTTVVNSSTMWVASQPTQLTVTIAGTYLLIGKVRYGASAAGTFRFAEVMINGTSSPGNVVADSVAPPGTAGSGSAATAVIAYRLAVGNTIFLAALQDSGGGLNTNVNAVVNSSLIAVWLSP